MQAEVKSDSVVSNPVVAPQRRWWGYEVWEDQRENFKALIGHVLFFLLLISALALGGFVIDLTHLTPGQKEFLHQLDFIGLFSCLLVFTIGFIIEFAVLTARRITYDHKQR